MFIDWLFTSQISIIKIFKLYNYFTGASLGSLSVGRLSIVNICVAYITKAVPIAIRYTAVRKQFGPPNGEELPVLEYQLVVSDFKFRFLSCIF